MGKKRCGDCRHLTDIRDRRSQSYYCEVAARPVPSGYGCSRWKNAMLWTKRAVRFITNLFWDIFNFFRYLRR